MKESGTKKWFLAAAIILIAIIYSQYFYTSADPIQPTLTMLVIATIEESLIPTSTSTSTPTIISTRVDMGVEEIIDYKCSGKGRVVYALITLSPFGGISPYEITVTPLIGNKLDLVHSYDVEPSKPFGLPPGVSVVYTAKSGSPDHQPDVSGNITIPLNSEEICNTNKQSVKIVVNSPVPVITPDNDHPTDTPKPIQPDKTSTPIQPTNTSTPIRPTDTPTLIRPTNAPTPIPPNKSECEDGIDNDGDGSIDLEDDDCSGSHDNHEDK